MTRTGFASHYQTPTLSYSDCAEQLIMEYYTIHILINKYMGGYQPYISGYIPSTSLWIKVSDDK